MTLTKRPAAPTPLLRDAEGIGREHRFETGFTLLELMVTVSIAAILLAIAAPNFTYMTVTNRLNTATNDLVYALNTARMAAIKSNANIAVCATSACMVTTTTVPATTLRGPIDGVSSTIQIQNVTSLIYSGQGLAHQAGSTTLYEGLVADIFTTSITTNNRRCLYMAAGGSILQTCTLSSAGACPNVQPIPCN